VPPALCVEQAILLRLAWATLTIVDVLAFAVGAESRSMAGVMAASPIGATEVIGSGGRGPASGFRVLSGYAFRPDE
jgi:hypothetical protein